VHNFFVSLFTLGALHNLDKYLWCVHIKCVFFTNTHTQMFPNKNFVTEKIILYFIMCAFIFKCAPESKITGVDDKNKKKP